MRLFLGVLCALVLCVAPSYGQEDVKDLETKLQVAKNKLIALHKEGHTVAQHLQDISLTIVCDGSEYGRRGEGSGEIVTRVRDGKTINFVWTAAHVVEGLRTMRSVIDPKTGSTKTIVEFHDAKIMKSLSEEGRSVGKLEMFAEVVRYSADEDLALLRVRKENFVTASVDFYLEDKIPPLGTKLFHVGSLLGQMGSNSLTEGIMSQQGRLIDKRVFDQTTVTAFPGSSGGGVYLGDGRMVGMVTRGAGETFNLIVPVRRMTKWAKDAGILWAVDPKIALPSEDELRKIPVEDIGVSFSYSVKNDMPGAPKTFGSGPNYLGSEEEKYPTLYRLITPPKKDGK